jgi:hypothetical protein
MPIKYTNIFSSKALQNLPKFGFLVWKHTIWQPGMETDRIKKPKTGSVFRNVLLRGEFFNTESRWPDSWNFRPLGACLLCMGSFLGGLSYFFQWKRLGIGRVGLHFGWFFTDSSGHPDQSDRFVLQITFFIEKYSFHRVELLFLNRISPTYIPTWPISTIEIQSTISGMHLWMQDVKIRLEFVVIDLHSRQG